MDAHWYADLYDENWRRDSSLTTYGTYIVTIKSQHQAEFAELQLE
jgi:hypothetical protein